MFTAAYNTANFAGTMGRAGVNRLRGNVPPSEIAEAYRAADELGLTKLAQPSWAERQLLEARVGDNRKLAFFPKEQQPFVLPAAKSLIAVNDARKKYDSLLTPHAMADYESYKTFGGKRKRKRNRKTNKQKSKKTKTRTRRTRKYRRY
jgi:hypothetical protein